LSKSQCITAQRRRQSGWCKKPVGMALPACCALLRGLQTRSRVAREKSACVPPATSPAFKGCQSLRGTERTTGGLRNRHGPSSAVHRRPPCSQTLPLQSIVVALRRLNYAQVAVNVPVSSGGRSDPRFRRPRGGLPKAAIGCHFVRNTDIIASRYAITCRQIPSGWRSSWRSRLRRDVAMAQA